MTLNKKGPVSRSHLIKKVCMWQNSSVTEPEKIASVGGEANAEFCPSVWKLLPFSLSAIQSSHCLPTDAGEKSLLPNSVTKDIRTSS